MGLIAGILNFKGQSTTCNELLKRMRLVQQHRDDSNPIYYITSYCGIVMSNQQNNCFDRKITHQQAGSEIIPGVAAFVDGIVLDVQKHAQYFEQRGYGLSVRSGSSIIAAAYKEWGKDFRKHLEGEFACVVWDETEKTLLLSRDPYGHKPLHYSFFQGSVLFSSEAKGILAAGVPPEVDLISISDYLSLNCIPNPTTIFRHIRQVAPGETIIVNSERLLHHVYWVPMFEEDYTLKLDDIVIQMSDVIRNAVKKRIIHDEVYCFLSGGVDSSLVLSFASELTSKPVNAVTIGFEESESDELPDAIAMAQHIGAKHYHMTAKAGLFFNMLDTLVFHHDAPFSDTSAFPTYYAGMLGHQYTDTILTGDGPDQTMAGSSHYVFATQNDIFARRRSLARKFYRLSADMARCFCNDLSPSLLSKGIRNLYRKSLDPIHAAYELRSYFPNLIKEYLCEDELRSIHIDNDPYRHPRMWFAQSNTQDSINQYLYADIKFYMPEDLMVKVDRMCMAHGLETLSPFQDVELADIVSRLPSKFKLYISPQGEISTKYILKQIAKLRFPESLLNKKKQGFAIPVDSWLRQNQGKYLKDILLDSRTLNRGYFKKKNLERFIYDFLDNQYDYYYAGPYSMVSLLTLEIWHRLYVDGTIKAL